MFSDVCNVKVCAVLCSNNTIEKLAMQENSTGSAGSSQKYSLEWLVEI